MSNNLLSIFNKNVWKRKFLGNVYYKYGDFLKLNINIITFFRRFYLKYNFGMLFFIYEMEEIFLWISVKNVFYSHFCKCYLFSQKFNFLLVFFN